MSCVLIVYRAGDCRDMTMNSLKDLGHTCFVADSPAEAQLVLNTRSVDSVMIDSKWLVRDDIQFVKQMHNNFAHIPIVAATENPSVQQAADVIHPGVLDYVALPAPQHRLAALFFKIDLNKQLDDSPPGGDIHVENVSGSKQDPKEAIHEIYHRVKNTLQIISSLIDLSGLYLENQKDAGVFSDIRDKVFSIALVYTQLYKSHDPDYVEIGEIFEKIYDYLFSIHSKDRYIENTLEIDKIYLPVRKAIPVVLVTHEMIANAFKHAFKGRSSGKIIIECYEQNNKIQLRIRDNGTGIPANVDIFSSKKIGLKLAKNLIEKQLGGTLELSHNGGTIFHVCFQI